MSFDIWTIQYKETVKFSFLSYALIVLQWSGKRKSVAMKCKWKLVRDRSNFFVQCQFKINESSVSVLLLVLCICVSSFCLTNPQKANWSWTRIALIIYALQYPLHSFSFLSFCCILWQMFVPHTEANISRNHKQSANKIRCSRASSS